MRDVYDEVAYPGSAFADTHPDRLATIARLHGLSPARSDGCRVLEVGCGDGANLISLAYALPDATFTGIDRAASAIERGRAEAAALGLRNVRLETADLLDVAADPGPFDAIIAHGLFSWVPEAVRLRTLEICAASLAPHGVAFISYLALPGNHGRDVYREIMRFHVRGERNPAERVRQSRAIMRLVADSPGGRADQRAMARSVADELERADDGVLYHDFLADINAPYLFADFVRLAGAAGLQFLSEAEFAAGFFDAADAPSHVADALRRLEADVLLREQYHDFLRQRGFRQTLLVRASAAITRPAAADRVRSLHIAARVATADGMVDLREGVSVRFATRGGPLDVADAVGKAALAVLGSAWPASLEFAALLTRVREVSPRAPDEAYLATFVLGAYARSAVDLWTCPPRCSAAAGERPEGSALARRQLARGLRRVSNLRNETVELHDDFGVAVLSLLDGQRDRAAIVEVLAAGVLSGGGTLELEGRPVTAPAEVHAVLAERIEDALEELAANALLIR